MTSPIVSIDHKADEHGNHWLEITDEEGTVHKCRPGTHESVVMLQHGDEVFAAVTDYYNGILPEVFRVGPVTPDESISVPQLKLQFDDAEAT